LHVLEKCIFINLFTDIRISKKKYIDFFLKLRIFTNARVGIIRGGIFTNARVGIIHGGIFANARVGNIRDRIFTSARVRNIINKSSYHKRINV
jgi:hypothetical protein